MERRHFELIAGIINSMPKDGQWSNEEIAIRFADRLSSTNSNFQKERFITACLTGKMGKGRSHKDIK